MTTSSQSSSTPSTSSTPSRSAARRRVLTAGGVVAALGATTAVVLGVVAGGGGAPAVAAGTPAAPAASPAASAAATSSATAGAPAASGPATGSASTPASDTPAGGAGSGSAPAAVAAAFTTATTSDRSSVVAVPGGFEGADVDGGSLRFWTWDGAAWRVDGTSALPADHRGDDEVTWSATVADAALLDGMRHATVEIHDPGFTGDGSAATEFFTRGDAGWGPVESGSDGALHPAAEPVDPADQNGLWAGGGLFAGLLVTATCDLAEVPGLGDCTSPEYQTRSFWQWDGARFVAHGAVDPQG